MTTGPNIVDVPFEALTSDQRRELALSRLKAKNEFRVHAFVYVAINAMLVTLWAFTGNVFGAPAGTPIGFFWPIFPIVGWGVGVAIHGYTAFRGSIYTEEQIQRELRNLP
jgi:hypothetical protein